MADLEEFLNGIVQVLGEPGEVQGTRKSADTVFDDKDVEFRFVGKFPAKFECGAGCFEMAFGSSFEWNHTPSAFGSTECHVSDGIRPVAIHKAQLDGASSGESGAEVLNGA